MRTIDQIITELKTQIKVDDVKGLDKTVEFQKEIIKYLEDLKLYYKSQ